MGSARSPPPSSLYTHKHKSSKSSSSSHDHPHHNQDQDDLFPSSTKKKKKSKKEHHHYEDNDQDEDNHRSHHHNHRPYSPSPPPPVQKLPPIKISLRLPANPSIIPPTQSSSSHKSPSSSSSKKKKHRSRNQDALSEDNEEQDDEDAWHRRHQREYSYDDQDTPASSSHKKKKKKHHKHKHRHSKHEYEDSGREEERDQAFEHEEADEPDQDQDQETRLTLRLGKKERKKSKKSHRSHHSHPPEDMEAQVSAPTPLSPPTKKARSRSRSMSHSMSFSPVVVKQEEPFRQPAYPEAPALAPHVQIGQKRPFSSLQSQRSVSEDTDTVDQGEPMDEDDIDDPLAGELDEPDEDDDEDEDTDDDEDMMSPTPDPSGHGQFGMKSVQSGHTGAKSVPQTVRVPKLKKPRKPKMSNKEPVREGSATVTTKSGRKGKTPKRLLTPKPSTPAVPKKKELSIVCHKLLDAFIKRDVYVLFTQPVDPELVPDYSTVIKNPMDFSTMRAKVERNFYPTIDEFLQDFQLVCDNARLYNSKETLYWKQADKLWDWGSRAIERERKTILDKDEEMMLQNVKDEETLDVDGMGEYHLPNLPSRGSIISIDGAVDSPMSWAETGRPHTPQQYRKSKKIKHRRDGTIAISYSTDGSIDPNSHPDPWSLVPLSDEFGSAPPVCPLVETNVHYNGLYLDEYPYWNAPGSGFRPAGYQDYGLYAILEKPQQDGNSGVENIPAYTGMVFGDEQGEAYVRSLAMFLQGVVDESELEKMNKEDKAGLLQVREYVHRKVETLTRGASTIVDKVAQVVREEKEGLGTGLVDARVPLSLWRQETASEKTEEGQADVEMKEADNEKGASVPDTATVTTDANTAESQNLAQDEDSVIIKEEDELGQETNSALMDKAAVGQEQKGASPSLQGPGSEPAAEPEMIDIRKVVQVIKDWPRLLKAKNEYEEWKKRGIELDNLLPPTAPSPASTIAAAGADEVKVLWGEKWTGGDSEESKKWVSEYLSKNAEEIATLVLMLGGKAGASFAETIAWASSLSTTGPSTAATAATMSGSSVPSIPPVTTMIRLMEDGTLSRLKEEEKAVVESLIKSLRKRLAEMAKYVPLSEVNPKRLPPPALPVPTTAPATAAPVSTPTPGSAPVVAGASAPALSTVPVPAPASTPAVVPAHVPATFAQEGSVSSLSSPGSTSSP